MQLVEFVPLCGNRSERARQSFRKLNIGRISVDYLLVEVRRKLEDRGRSSGNNVNAKNSGESRKLLKVGTALLRLVSAVELAKQPLNDRSSPSRCNDRYANRIDDRLKKRATERSVCEQTAQGMLIDFLTPVGVKKQFRLAQF
ncbi:MAG: hypothetical protein ABJB97_09850 [Acidobacteriota bacterium]